MYPLQGFCKLKSGYGEKIINAARPLYALVRTDSPTKDQQADAYSRTNMLRHVEATAVKLGFPYLGYNGVRNYAARLDNAALLKAEHGDDWPMSVAERMACLNPRGSRRRYSDKTRQRYDRILLAAGHLSLDSGRDCFWHRKPVLQVVPNAESPDIFVRSQKQNFRTKPRIKGGLPGAPQNLAFKSDGCAVPLGSAKPCSKTKKSKTFGGPEGAASRHSERDGLGRYAPIARTGSPTPAALEEPTPELSADVSLSRNCSTPAPTTLASALPPPKDKPSTADKLNEPAKAIREDETMPVDMPTEIADVVRDTDLALLIAQARAACAKAAKDRQDAGIPDPEPWSPKPAAPRAPEPVLMANGLVQAPNRRTPQSLRLADDKTPADYTWLQFSLGGFKPLRDLKWQWAAKQGFTRGHWRAAVGALVGQAPGRVTDPVRYVIGILRQLQSGEASDCRSLPRYFPLPTWGEHALKFANVCESPLQS